MRIIPEGLNLDIIVKCLLAREEIGGVVSGYKNFDANDIYREGIVALKKFNDNQIDGVYKNQDIHSYVKRALEEFIIIKHYEHLIPKKIKEWRKKYGWQNDSFDYSNDAYLEGLLCLAKFAKKKSTGLLNNANVHTYLDNAIEAFMRRRKRILDGQEQGYDEAYMVSRCDPFGELDGTISADHRCDEELVAERISSSTDCIWAKSHALSELDYTTNEIAGILQFSPSTIRTILSRRDDVSGRAAWGDIQKLCQDDPKLLTGIELRAVELSYEKHHGQYLSKTEISKKMNMGNSSVQWYYQSARNKLRAIGVDIGNLPHKRNKIIQGK